MEKAKKETVKLYSTLPSSISLENNEYKNDLFKVESYKEQFDSKYNTLILNGEFYTLLLQVKSKIRKEIKDEAKLENLIKLLNYTGNILSDNDQFESLSDLIKYFIEEISKVHISEQHNINIASILKVLFVHLPKKNFNKSHLHVIILKYLMKNLNLPTSKVREIGLFRIFSEDALFNDSPIESYKLALLDESFDLLDVFIDLHLDQTENPLENLYFIVRIILELLIAQNEFLAKKIFLYKTVNHSLNNKLTEKDINSEQWKAKSHPLVNVAYLILGISESMKLNNQEFTYDHLKGVYAKYKVWLDNGSHLNQYLNELSKKLYNKTLFNSQMSGGLFSMLNGLLN